MLFNKRTQLVVANFGAVFFHKIDDSPKAYNACDCGVTPGISDAQEPTVLVQHRDRVKARGAQLGAGVEGSFRWHLTSTAYTNKRHGEQRHVKECAAKNRQVCASAWTERARAGGYFRL